MSTSSLQWVVSAYVLGYGGFLLLGGRAADLLGRRRVFLIALGVFVLLASRIPGFGKPVRVFAIVAAVPAIASLVSLAWFQGAALILLGRLLCIAWIISAAVSATRRLVRGTWSCPTAGTG